MSNICEQDPITRSYRLIPHGKARYLLIGRSLILVISSHDHITPSQIFTHRTQRQMMANSIQIDKYHPLKCLHRGSCVIVLDILVLQSWSYLYSILPLLLSPTHNLVYTLYIILYTILQYTPVLYSIKYTQDCTLKFTLLYFMLS